MSPLAAMPKTSADSQRSQAANWRENAKQDRAAADMHLRHGMRELADISNRSAVRCDQWAAECDEAAEGFDRLADSPLQSIGSF